MPRKARKYVHTTFFHIMCQGIKKENIFPTDTYIEKYLHLIKKYKDDFFIKIISYCIMPNHVHLLVHSYDVKMISRFMHKLNSIYGMYYNNSKERVGYVFRDRFRMEEITDQKYLTNCIIYIHNNPVKAGFCSLPAQYKFSSYKEFISIPKLVDKNLIRKILGNITYQEFEKSISDDIFEFEDIDISSETRAKEIITNFEKKHNKSISEILNNYATKKELLIYLHIKNKISYRCIEKVLPIKRRLIPNYLSDQKGQV